MSREIDIQIAQKLFGIPLKGDSVKRKIPSISGTVNIPCPYYSSSSIHVCEILEELRKRGYGVNTEHFSTSDGCYVEVRSSNSYAEGYAHNFPLALCKAALKALE